MIGKSEWFQRRKYGGWGLTPKDWRGWAYILVSAGLVFGVQAIVPENLKVPMLYAISIILSLDVIHIMVTMPKDELETKIEAISERNAAWGMIIILAVGVAYQAAQTTLLGINQVDPFLIAAMVVGVVLKSMTNLWLEKKGI